MLFYMFIFFTVNTMHTWPQVIALLSWLIDLVEFVTDGQDEYKDDYGIIYEVIINKMLIQNIQYFLSRKMCLYRRWLL